MLDGGTFILFNLIGFGCMIYGILASSILAKPLALLSILALMFLAFTMLQPQPVGVATNTTTTVKTFNINNTLVTNSTSSDSSQQVWIGSNLTRILPWIYFGFSFIPVYFLCASTFGKKGLFN